VPAPRRTLLSSSTPMLVLIAPLAVVSMLRVAPLKPSTPLLPSSRTHTLMVSRRSRRRLRD
jgi:hypothetical protein